MDELLRGNIHASLDGELDQAAEAALQTVLESDDQARRYYEQLVELNHLLSSVPSQDPPDGLHAAVVNHVSLPQPSLLDRLMGEGLFASAVRYGATAAAAVVVTLTLTNNQTLKLPENASGMAGTMSRDGIKNIPQTLDTFSFSQPGAQGEIVVAKRGDDYVIEVSLDSDGPLSLNLDFNGEAPSLNAFERKSGALGQAQFLSSGFSVNTEGSTSFEVLVQADRQKPVPGTKVALEVSRQGQVIESGFLEPGW